MQLSVRQGHTLDDVPEDVDRVTMGIRVSAKHLHLGHYVTLFKVAKLLAARPTLKGILYIDDREFHFPRNRSAKEKPLEPPYPHSINSVQDIVQKFFRVMEADLLCSGLVRRVKVLRMSELMRLSTGEADSTVGGAIYDQLISSREDIERFFPEFYGSQLDGQTEVVRPLCPDCQTVSPDSRNLKVTEKGMYDTCLKSGCDRYNNRFAVRPSSDVTDSWIIHYFIDPMRDRVMQGLKNVGVLHVFGGDYDRFWGQNSQKTLSQRQYQLMHTISGPPLHYFLGPVLNLDGAKIGSSRGHQCPQPSTKLLEVLTADNQPVIPVQNFPAAKAILRQTTDSELREFRRK